MSQSTNIFVASCNGFIPSFVTLYSLAVTLNIL